MSVNYQAEPFADLMPELRARVAAHWQEFASDRDAFGMDVDWDLYLGLAKAGKLYVITARRGAVLVGYFGAIVGTDPHRKGVSTAFSRFLYADKDPIRGLIVRGMIRESVRFFKAMGVRYYKYASKNQPIIDRILAEIGFVPIETVHSMVVDP
ncbi:MAG TPA: hypothetical protein VFB45_15405 [Pseudolabrys sp.]|nr:hypothetical protein [Pseudolabrys sp.]